MGDRGAWANWKGYGPITRAVSGLAWLWNHPEDAEDPQGVTTIHPDHQAGRWMALLAAALLLRRARTGIGGHADVAQVEVIVGQLGDLLGAESLAPGSVRPAGNQGPDAPWGVFRCADVAGGSEGAASEDWVAITVRDDADWARLVAVVGADGFEGPAGTGTTTGTTAGTTADRLAHRLALEEWLGRWTATQTATAVAERVQAAGVPAARLLHPRTLVADEHERARDFVVSLDQPGIGPMKFERPPWRGPDLGDFVETPAPWPGEHSRAVCHDWLGLDDGEIAGLLDAGVLEEYTG
jgi:crotonobetainyl-CoA:carnitine CoA-transferase CaiB-like acyl-CoA transferase